jgi:hypothetical protein
MTIMNTSPIETTADNLGNRMFIVAMKSEVIVKRAQGRENSFVDWKQRTVIGTASI